MNLLVRKAMISDFKFIQSLHLEIERVECPFDSNLVKDTFLSKEGIKTLRKNLENKDIYCLVALVNDEIVGFIDGEIQDKYFIKRKLHILGTYVLHRIIEIEVLLRGF